MKSTVEDKGVWQKSISIVVEPGDVGTEVDRMIKKYRKQAQLPGFRKGKVPHDVVKKTYWGQIRMDVLDTVVPAAIQEAATEHSFRVAGPPQIDDLHFEDDGDELTFTATVELWPDIVAQGIEEIEVEEDVIDVDDQMVDEFLETLRAQAATLEEVDRTTTHAGDLLEVAVQGADQAGSRLPRSERQTMRMEAGAQNLLPAFQEATVGAEIGDEKFLTVQYPENFTKQELAGETRYFLFRVMTIFERQLPDLDEEFAKKINDSDLAGLRTTVFERLEDEEKKAGVKRANERLVDRLIELNPFDVPDGMVERGITQGLTRARNDDPTVDEEQFRLSFTPRIVRMWRSRILLDSIAQKEEIRVTDDEIDERIRERAGAGVDVTKIRKQLRDSGDLEQVHIELLDERILDVLRERVKINRVQKPRQREAQSNIIIP